MTRIVLDTNVVISGIIRPAGPPGRILDHWLAGRLVVVASPSLVAEWLGVFDRTKFAVVGSRETRRGLILRLADRAELVQPQEKVSIVSTDPTDDRVLEAAVAGGVQCIVSGDAHLLSLDFFRGIAVRSPVDFLQNLRNAD